MPICILCGVQYENPPLGWFERRIHFPEYFCNFCNHFAGLLCNILMHLGASVVLIAVLCVWNYFHMRNPANREAFLREWIDLLGPDRVRAAIRQMDPQDRDIVENILRHRALIVQPPRPARGLNPIRGLDEVPIWGRIPRLRSLNAAIGDAVLHNDIALVNRLRRGALDICVICHAPPNIAPGRPEGASSYVVTECGHCFHLHCILQTYRRNRTQCPFCSAQL